MFCMQLIKWISASEDCGWCAGKTVPALVSGHINLMAGTLFSWTENPPSPLGLLKIECCWDNTLSESPWVWFPAGSSPPVSLAAWMTPVRACVDAVCWRKGLLLLSVPVLFICEFSSEICSNDCYVYIPPIAPGGTQHVYGPYASSRQVLQAPARYCCASLLSRAAAFALGVEQEVQWPFVTTDTCRA